MTHKWQLQDAKAKFSEVVKRAATEGPQVVTQRGVEAAVVMSMADYRRLEASRPSLIEYLRGGPALDEETLAVINDRSKDTGREIDL